MQSQSCDTLVALGNSTVSGQCIKSLHAELAQS
jgi:hypothetical protein